MSTAKVNKDMTFVELLNSNPKAGEVLARYGMHCIGCHMSAAETVEQGCKAHGMDDAAVEKIVNELNS